MGDLGTGIVVLVMFGVLIPLSVAHIKGHRLAKRLAMAAGLPAIALTTLSQKDVIGGSAWVAVLAVLFVLTVGALDWLFHVYMATQQF